MSFSPSISVQSVSPGVIMLTDNSALGGNDVLGNFLTRSVSIVQASGMPLPNPVGTNPAAPLRTAITWPIVALTGDTLIVPTNMLWDTVISVTVTYTPLAVYSGSVYTNLLTTYTCSYINQCYLQQTDKFYVNGQVTYERSVIDLNKKISGTMDALDIAMATGDLIDAQMMINAMQDLCVNGNLNRGC